MFLQSNRSSFIVSDDRSLESSQCYNQKENLATLDDDDIDSASSISLIDALNIPLPEPEKVPFHHSDFVYKEIVKSEKDYVGFLGSFLQIYGSSLRHEASSNSNNNPKWITMEQVEALFHHWSLLETFHSSIIFPLFSASESPNEISFDKFLKVLDILHILYLHYTVYYDVQGERMYETLGQRKMFRNWEKEQNKRARFGQIGFKTYTIMPIQRLPRYLLLFEELQKTKPSNKVSVVCDRLRNIINHINNSKRELDDRLKLLNFQKRISNSLLDLDAALSLASCQTLLYEGELTLQSIEQITCIKEVIVKTLKTDIKGKTRFSLTSRLHPFIVCDQWVSISLKFTPDQTVYMLDWTEMHILRYFDLRYVVVRALGDDSILILYDDQLVFMKRNSDLLEALAMYGDISLCDRLVVDKISDFNLIQTPSLHERPVTCDKAYLCLLVDKMLVLCKSSSSSSSGEGLKLKYYKTFKRIRRVESGDGNFTVWIGLTKYLFREPEDGMSIWVQKFTSLKSSQPFQSSPMKPVEAKIEKKDIGDWGVLLGITLFSFMVFGSNALLVILGIFIGRVK